MVEEGGVPVAFKNATRHEEELSIGMEGESFHEAFSDFTFDGFTGFFDAVVPSEFLPELLAVAGGRVGGAAHSGEVEGLVIGREVEGEDAAGVVVSFDDSPAGEVGCFDAGDFFPSLFEIPEDDFAHEVSCGEELTVV